MDLGPMGYDDRRLLLKKRSETGTGRKTQEIRSTAEVYHSKV